MPKPLIRPVLIPALALACLGLAIGADWTVLRHDERDYVSFGNVARFYRFPEHTRGVRTVSLRSDRRRLRAVADKNEIFINGVRFFTCFPIVTNGSDELISSIDVNKVLEPILRPHHIEDGQKIDTVVLDPGHGGVDQGTANRWGTEKAFALDVALQARESLVRAGFKVEMTRTTDEQVSLEQRIAFANRFPNAVLISIHFNSGGGTGVESYSLTPAGVPSSDSTEDNATTADMRMFDGNGRDALNMALAAAVHASVLSRVPTFDRGVRHARFRMLRDARIPSVLVEGGFLSNPEEAARIATPHYQQQLGFALAQAIQSYNTAVNFRANGATFAMASNTLPPHSDGITEPLREGRPPNSDEVNKASVTINGGR